MLKFRPPLYVGGKLKGGGGPLELFPYEGVSGGRWPYPAHSYSWGFDQLVKHSFRPIWVTLSDGKEVGEERWVGVWGWKSFRDKLTIPVFMKSLPSESMLRDEEE